MYHLGHRPAAAMAAAMKEVWAHTPPRVVVVLLYAILNGWATLRRFQLQGRCRLCNRPGTVGSIEHLPLCRTV